MNQLNPLLEGKIGKLLARNSTLGNVAGTGRIKKARRAAAKALKDARKGEEYIHAGPFSYIQQHGALKGSNKARDIQDTIYNSLLGNDSWAVRPDLKKVM